MKKFLLVVPGYPSTDNLYNNAFVHSRVKDYKKRGMNVDVFSFNSRKTNEYTYDGIVVKEGGSDELIALLENDKYEKILVHFAWRKIMRVILSSNVKLPIIIWVHGVEALGWYRRLFNYKFKESIRFLGYIVVNKMQLLFMNRLIRKYQDRIIFVFVSNWMKNILEIDSFSRKKIKNFEIIPNVIDDQLFDYVEKDCNQRFNILSIRPYASKKYANDISVKVVLQLSKKEYFSKLNFYFYGSGKLFEKTLKPLVNFSNVKIEKRFLKQEEIAIIHKKCGILLTPTRQDAQGVSMCEGMSSGLVPITSNNTAIPEYVSAKSGFLCNNVTEMVAAIESLVLDPNKFKIMSKLAATNIRKLCCSDIVIDREIKIINR